MKASDALIKAKALIDTPEKWTKDAFQRDAYGTAQCQDEKATCYCSIGAIGAASRGQDAIRVVVRATNMLWFALSELKLNFNTVIQFNDYASTTHEQVMKLFDRAVELAKKGENGNT